MKQQLIITILGADRVGILSDIARTVSETGCNILDSRQAIYGQDFSLTMILEGNQSAVTKAELKLPYVCNQLDLLSMMKRTKQHCKQNIEHLVDIEFSGVDAVGVIQKITSKLAEYNVAINAFRQNTYTSEDNQQEMMKCKMVASVPQEGDMQQINAAFNGLLQALSLTGHISENH